MILRLLRLRVRPGAEPGLMERLGKQAAHEEPAADGMLGLNFGLRIMGQDTHGLVVSVWRDFDAAASTAGELGQVGIGPRLDDLVDDVSTAHYEVSEPESEGRLAPDTAVIAVMASRLKPHLEAAAYDMIRESAPGLYAAGAAARYVGRRIEGSRMEVAAVAIWPDRATLHEYARTTPGGMIRPEYLDLLERWAFETYDAMSSHRLLMPSAAPAVLLADDEGRYVDASVGVERVSGIPGEFMIGRTVWDFTGLEDLEQGRKLWRDFIAAGSQEGEYPLMQPDGTTVLLHYRAVANQPRPGLHASVLSLPDEPGDGREPADIVAEAFPQPEG